PVIGVASKAESDIYSVGDRSTATFAGLQALLTDPFGGGHGAASVGAVNMVAAIASFGLLYVLFTTVALWSPMFVKERPIGALVPVGVVFLTLLLSQPPLDSTWAYVCALLAYAVNRPEAPSETLD